MRYQFGSICYSGSQSVLSAIASEKVGEIINHNGVIYVVDIAKITDKSITYKLKSLIGKDEIIKIVELEPLPCQLLDYDDALLLSWSIVGVWIVVASIVYLRRAMGR